MPRRRRSRPRRRPDRWVHALLAVVCLAAAVVLVASWPGGGRATAENDPPGPPLRTGGDASWPTCAHPTAHTLVPRPAFAIVGVNDGEPGTRSACLARTLRWAATAVGGSAQPPVAFYLMAADPWQPAERRWAKPVWPRSAVLAGTRIPVPAAYGTACTGGRSSRACAYLFGWSAVTRSVAGIRHAERYRYWLDVETERDFSADPLFNQAIVEGMAAAVTAPAARGGVGARVGIYSNVYFWSRIVGPLRPGSPLAGLDEWYPIGRGTLADARRAFATQQPFAAGGRITIVQVVQGSTDVDYAPAA